MFLKYITTSAILLCATCCPEDDYDCATVLCAGPPAIIIEVLANEENVFENETYSIEDISIEGTNANDFNLSLFENQDAKILLVIENSDWPIGSNEVNLNFSDDSSIPVQMDIALSASDECCGGIPRLESLVINGIVQNNVSSIYTITLD